MTMPTMRPGGTILPYWFIMWIVTVPVYDPAQAVTMHIAVIIRVPKDGPHEIWPEGAPAMSSILLLPTAVVKTMLLTGGAHLNESETLPELPFPALPEKVIATGFADHIAFGEPLEPNPISA